MSGSTLNTKTFYIPVSGDISVEDAFKLAKKFKKDSDGIIKLKEEK